VTGLQAGGAIAESGRLPEVWGRIPPRNMNFTGRDGLLEQLRVGLATKVTAVLPHALHGYGGVGKSQVAIEFAYRNASSYDVVWWIPADQPALVRSSLAALAPRLGLPAPTATGTEEAMAVVLDALRLGRPYARWLLIFDNADEPEEINEYIPRGPGHTLVTSRNQRWQGVVETLPVDVFSREESIAFLTRRARRAIKEQDAHLLAEELGDLPLALEQAGAFQAESGMPVQEYLDLLSKQTKVLLGASRSPDYPLTMTAAWQISVGRLNQTEPTAVELLRCCAFFGPEPIPRDVFRHGIQAARPHLAEILGDPILLSMIVRDLGRFALANIDPSNRTIQVHRLIQRLLREELSEGDQAEFRHEVHLLLASAAPPDPSDESKWPRFAELVAHVTPASVAECGHPQVREFALNMVRYLYLSGDYASARAFVEAFIEQWSGNSGEEHADVFTAQWYLGDILRDQGHYNAAYELTETALAHAQNTLGPEHLVSLALATGFGADLRARGDFATAHERDLESVRICESALPPGDPRTLIALHCLALDLGLIGDYLGASDLHQRSYVALSQASSGVTKVDVIAAWTSLARAVRLSGQYAKARILSEDAYEYGRQQLGADHPWTLRSGKVLSVALRVAAATPEDLELARDVLERSKRLLGQNNADSLAAAIALSNTLRMAGEIEEALALAEDTISRYPSAFDADHPFVHACKGNVAILRRLHGDAASARDLDETILARLDARLGRDHDYALSVATNLASDLAALGDVHAARLLGEDTLLRVRNMLGSDHPAALGCAANLALDLHADGEAEQAAQVAAITLDRFASLLGSDHPLTRAAAEGKRIDADFDPPPI
jgi:tetratricopeptide (TPR) repeat protein